MILAETLELGGGVAFREFVAVLWTSRLRLVSVCVIRVLGYLVCFCG